SSHIDRSAFTDDSELNVESLIENLKNTIMKELSVLYVIRSLTSLSALSVSFSAALSQSSTPVPVSGSPALTTPGFAVSAFIISSSHFKEMLHRLNKPCLSRIISLLNSVEIVKDICVFRNRNADVVLFYTCECETHTSFTLISEVILIKDDNTAETTLSHSQASLITFSSFSVRKVVHIL
ncbi:hypothetical protein BDDG_13175, partial [Blastomyces dermatitidis ATCC 18188]